MWIGKKEKEGSLEAKGKRGRVEEGRMRTVFWGCTICEGRRGMTRINKQKRRSKRREITGVKKGKGGKKPKNWSSSKAQKEDETNTTQKKKS